MFRYTDKKTGKRETVYAKDLPELRLKEKQIQRDLDNNLMTDSGAKKMTVNTLFERYMNTRVLTASTKVLYQNMWDYYVKENLGDMIAVNLVNSDIKKFYREFSDKNLSHGTIELIHRI